jgi:hypothetical protein
MAVEKGNAKGSGRGDERLKGAARRETACKGQRKYTLLLKASTT